MVIELYHAAFIAVAAFLFCEVLTRAGQVFAWWPGVVGVVFRMRGKHPSSYTLVQKIAAAWFYDCAKCQAGVISGFSYIWWPPSGFEGFALRITAAIFIAFFLQQRYESGSL